MVKILDIVDVYGYDESISIKISNQKREKTKNGNINNNAITSLENVK